MKEIWADIDWIEDINPVYQVSTKGRVRNKVSGKVMKPILCCGYHEVHIKTNTEKVITHHLKINRLVALAFIENPDNKPQVNHINQNKLDNTVENLEWVTPRENIQHARMMKKARNEASQIPLFPRLMTETDIQVEKPYMQMSL